MTSDHEQLRTALGAYVLGALPDDEVRVLEQHLATCGRCRAECDDLVPAASVLGELKRETLPHPSAVPPLRGPDGLEPLVLTRIAEEQARERRTAWVGRAALTAVAGAAAAAVLVLGLAVTGSEPDPVPAEAVAVNVREDGVSAEADLVNHTWGVEVRLTGSGFDAGRRYRVAVVGTDGKRHSAGEFVGTGDREMVCNLNSSVLRDQATGFEVRDRDGDVVVRSTFA